MLSVSMEPLAVSAPVVAPAETDELAAVETAVVGPRTGSSPRAPLSAALGSLLPESSSKERLR